MEYIFGYDFRYGRWEGEPAKPRVLDFTINSPN